MAQPAYRRILLKLSGEIFSSEAEPSAESPEAAPTRLATVGAAIQSIRNAGVQTAIVLGGGNILRGAQIDESLGIARAVGDQMGMLATVINALAFREYLHKSDIDARVLSAIRMPQICESYTRESALAHLEAGRVVLFAGGTGHPFLTTDTAASLRAAEIGADLMVKATKVDGVYSGDPMQDADAQRYDRISYERVSELRLGVMDAAAVIICQENDIPVRVVNMSEANTLFDVVVDNKDKGTIIDNG